MDIPFLSSAGRPFADITFTVRSIDAGYAFWLLLTLKKKSAERFLFLLHQATAEHALSTVQGMYAALLYCLVMLCGLSYFDLNLNLICTHAYVRKS